MIFKAFGSNWGGKKRYWKNCVFIISNWKRYLKILVIKRVKKNVHLVGGYLDYRPGLQIKIEQIPYGNYYNQLF